MLYIACIQTLSRQTKLFIRETKEELEEALYEVECETCSFARYDLKTKLMHYLDTDLEPLPR